MRERIERYAKSLVPNVTLLLRTLGKERAILHVERLSGDAPAVLLHLLTGAYPTRYDFLSDDATEDASLAPPTLYAEEGVVREAVRPDGNALAALLEAKKEALPLKGIIDIAAEQARLEKERAKADADIKRVDAKLGNEKFVANAPEDIVEEEKEKREAAAARKAKILEALERLKNAA